VKNPVRVQVQVLDTVVLEETLEEVARQEGQPRSTNRANIRISSGFFSIGYGSPAVAHHMSIFFSWRKPLFTSASKSSVFAFDFFQSLFRFGRGGEVGGIDPWADPATSSRDLFFPAPVFMLFDGEDFVLQMHRVFTRIHSGASLEADNGRAHGSIECSAAAVGLLARSISNGCKCGGWKTLRVLASIYKPTGGAATTRWISIGR
jgi:hypothetical protein